MAPIDLVVTPEPRDPSHPPRRVRFITEAVTGRVLGTFSAPLCSSARVLLAEGIPPETVLQMRHAGSDVIALRAKLSVAARLKVNEEGSTGTPRFAEWTSFDHSRLEAA
jgi:hypothetical protein